MSIEISKGREGNLYYVNLLDGNKTVGRIEAISDGVEWSRITDITLDRNHTTDENKKLLIEEIKEVLKDHHIFTVIKRDDFDIFESLGFFRSKTSFTYEDNVTEQEKEDREREGLFLPENFRYEDEFYPRKPFIDNGSVKKKENVGEIRYIDTLKGVSFEEINEVLSKAFGGHERDVNKTKEVFVNSDKVELAFDGDNLVGVARAVTDRRANALILNVAVDPSYQGFHIGWNVVVKLSEQLPGFSVFLNTHPGAVGFYNRKGFRRNRTAFVRPAGNMPPEMAKGFQLPAGYRFPDEY